MKSCFTSLFHFTCFFLKVTWFYWEIIILNWLRATFLHCALTNSSFIVTFAEQYNTEKTNINILSTPNVIILWGRKASFSAADWRNNCSLGGTSTKCGTHPAQDLFSQKSVTCIEKENGHHFLSWLPFLESMFYLVLLMRYMVYSHTQKNIVF